MMVLKQAMLSMPQLIQVRDNGGMKALWGNACNIVDLSFMSSRQLRDTHSCNVPLLDSRDAVTS